MGRESPNWTPLSIIPNPNPKTAASRPEKPTPIPFLLCIYRCRSLDLTSADYISGYFKTPSFLFFCLFDSIYPFDFELIVSVIWNRWLLNSFGFRFLSFNLRSDLSLFWLACVGFLGINDLYKFWSLFYCARWFWIWVCLKTLSWFVSWFFFRFFFSCYIFTFVIYVHLLNVKLLFWKLGGWPVLIIFILNGRTFYVFVFFLVEANGRFICYCYFFFLW